MSSGIQKMYERDQEIHEEEEQKRIEEKAKTLGITVDNVNALEFVSEALEVFIAEATMTFEQHTTIKKIIKTLESVHDADTFDHAFRTAKTSFRFMETELCLTGYLFDKFYKIFNTIKDNIKESHKIGNVTT
jgi:hypothetical protein